VKIIPVYSQLQWTLIETEMLLVHAKCLKVLNRRDDYVRMLLGLLALVVSAKTTTRINEVAHHLDIESYQVQGKSLLSELNTVAAQLPYDITVDLSTYFQNIRLDPYIRHHPKDEGFQLRLKLKSVFEDDMIIKHAKVVLTPLSNNSASEIHLQSEGEIKISKGSATIVLSTNTSTYGRFAFKQATLQSGRILFVYSPVDDQVLATLGGRTKASRVLVYPRNDAFSVKTSMCRTIHIERSRRLEIECSNGPEEMKEINIKLKPASSGLRIRSADAEIISGKATLKKNESTSGMVLLNLASHSKVKISIPYELDDSHSEIFVGIEVSSSSPKLDYRSLQSVVVELPLDVNVHDLFKSADIFQRFHIKSSNDVPLQILNLDFQDTDAFAVIAPPGELFPTTVFAKHPATYMYSVKQKKNKDELVHKRKSSSEEAPLVLTVDYQCYDELASETILRKFTTDLRSTSLTSMESLLLHTLKERLQRVLSPPIYTESALLGHIACPDFQEIGWALLLRDLPPSLSEGLKTWLESWHLENQQLTLPLILDSSEERSASDGVSPRKIVISVPLPHLDILQIATLTIPKSDLLYAAVGTPLCAKLALHHTKIWGIRGERSQKNIEFMYDIDAPADTWLIGGQRRGRFTAEEHESKTWEVILIPLRTGKLLLPFVDVRVVGKDADYITCETEFKGFGKTVTVVGHLSRTTVSMTGNEAKLLSAES